MPITPDRLSRLREFGLSEYAGRAYLALLDLGVAEARDISTLSKVPQAKIYHVLEQLHDKGLAVILPEFPKKYAPIAFSEFVDRIHDEHHLAAQTIDRDREVLAEMFRVVGETDVGNRGFFTVVRGRRNVITKMQELINHARRDVLILATAGFATRYKSVIQELGAAKSRGARLRALIPLDAETIPLLDHLSGMVELRDRVTDVASPSSRVALVLVDNTKAFLINFLPDDDNLYAGKDVAMFTDQEPMVAALSSLVEPCWDRAAPLASRVGGSRVSLAELGLGPLFGATREAVVVADREGVIVAWNAPATTLFGVEGAGLNVADVIPKAAASFADAAHGTSFEGVAGGISFRIVPHALPDGSTFAVCTASGPASRREVTPLQNRD